MPPAVCGAAPASGNSSLIDIITTLGLTTNLKLCLDAGDADSYDPGVQTAKWLDTSGNGHDFYRGTSGVGDGAEPTFNGSAGGLSSAEYFSFDGGDRLDYDTTNETWMENIHKDNAIFSFMFAYRRGTGASSYRLFNTHISATAIGFNISHNSNPAVLDFRVGNGTSNPFSQQTTGTFAQDTWTILQGSLNEATGASGALLKINGSTAETFTSTYTSPSTGAAAAATIGSRPGGAGNLPSGSRLACMAIWEGTALSATNLTDIYNAIKGRFGL